VNNIWPHLRKQGGAVSEKGGNVEALSHALGPGTGQVTDSDNLDVRQLAKACQMLAGNLPSAY
jgi:hypothetical protein